MDLNNIHEDWKKEAPILAAMEAANPFTVPDNYFIELKEQISARLTIESIAGEDKDGAFAVPEGYFESLEEQIISKIKLEELKESIPTEGYSVPEGYFEELSHNITSRIQIEELVNKDRTVASFTVPDNYFNKLQDNILAKTVEAGKERQVKIKRLSTSWIRYAAAACVTVMIATGIFLNYSKKEDADIDSALSKIPEHEIVNYLQASATLGDSEVIFEQIKETGVTPKTEAGFSEKEIESYLETSL